MEIKKIIGKIFAAVAIGFALMVLYTNAFPLSFSVKSGWVEDNDLGRAIYNQAINYELYRDSFKDVARPTEEINKAAIKDLENFANHDSHYKYDKKKDKFYYRESYRYEWAGLSFDKTSSHYGNEKRYENCSPTALDFSKE